MAKVRVYELAKDLETDSKKLVEKLINGGVNIKNYMSTLDEEAVTRAREIFSGAVSQVVEEKRIKPTVIRRRKKIVKVEEKAPEEKIETAPEVGEETSEPEPGPPPVEEIEAVEEAPEVVEVTEEPEPPVAEETPEPPPEEKAEPPKKKPKSKPKKAKRKKGDEPAKIIKLPEEGPLKELLAQKEKAAAMPRKGKPPARKPAEIAKEVVKDAKRAKPARRKKDRKTAGKPEGEAKAPQRRAKKEIYERVDLYRGRATKRKGKKAGEKFKEAVKRQKQTEITVPKAIKRRIKVQEFVTVAELAKAMGIKAPDLIKKLLSLGVVANINQPLDFETASLVADEWGYELELGTFQEESFIADTEDKPEDLTARPPVVTIMGHVDHGKTSLLDYIRKSNVLGGESGGITQHIGAYYVNTDAGDIVFLDTPGHEAFTAMRARGAKVTDLIILVVAADDGVMPQTKEAVNHAKAANIPIVVAVNKIDKAEVDLDKVKRELADLGLSPEDWGGDTIYGYVSAKTGEGIDELLSMISLQSEMLELKGNPNKAARGSIVEAKLDKSKGAAATVLISNGTLKKGDFFVCGEYYGRVRAMVNHRGRVMKSVGPSMPAEIYGINGVPMAGDEFVVVQDEKSAKQIIDHRREKAKKTGAVTRGVVSLEDLFDRIKEGNIKELNIVIKGDVQGSIEALNDSMEKQSTDEVKVKIIHAATGAITESDVLLASASGAIIVGFNVRTNPRVRELADREKVDVRYYDVIYNVIKDIRLAMTGLLEPTFRDVVIGHATVKELIKVPKIGAIAGCQVTDGHVERNSHVRLLRDDVVVYDGKLASLRRFKDDVKEVQSGYECGISLENFQDVKPNDVFEMYRLEEVEAEL